MFANKTKVLLIVSQDILDQARVCAGKATTELKMPVSLQIVLRALIEEGLKRGNDRNLLANIQGQAHAEPQPRRQGGEVFATLDPVRQPLAPGVGTAILQVSTVPSRLMLVSRGWQDGHPLTHEIQAVFAIVGQRLVLQSSWERDR